MKKFLAIVLCRILTVVGKLVGKGTSLPGKFALKLCPDILRRIEKPKMIVAVTGSNGKTSTVEMIASVLKAAGKTVAYNAEGSNQIEGVTTMILNSCSLSGKMKQDVLLIESDERYTKHTFKWFHPTHYVMTNLYRDQLTRNGHPEWVYDAIKESIFDETTLLLNADDPMISQFGHGRENVLWFGVEPCEGDTEEPVGSYHDSRYCPLCGKPLNYKGYHFGNLGFYSCESCGYHRHKADFAVTKADLAKGEIVVNGEDRITLAFKSLYNVYNILAAYSICSLLGIPGEQSAKLLSDYILKNGRYVEFALGDHEGTFLISKHENSVSYDMSLNYAVALKKKCSVVIIVDAVSRKYFTSETSWLWDIHFDCLNSPFVENVYLCGKYCNDLALRFSFTDVPQDKIKIFSDVNAACESMKSGGKEQLYAVTCFSDKDKFLSNVTKK